MRSTIFTIILVFTAILAAGCGPSLPDPQPISKADFAGKWYSSWGRMDLLQKGSHVHGTYKGFRIGSLSGELEGNLFKFKWTQIKPRMHGRGYLQMSADGRKLDGKWGYKKNYFNGGRWTATRD